MTESDNYSNIMVFKPLALVGTPTTDKVCKKNIDKGNNRFGCDVGGRIPKRFLFCKGLEL